MYDLDRPKDTSWAGLFRTDWTNRHVCTTYQPVTSQHHIDITTYRLVSWVLLCKAGMSNNLRNKKWCGWESKPSVAERLITCHSHARQNGCSHCILTLRSDTWKLPGNIQPNIPEPSLVCLVFLHSQVWWLFLLHPQSQKKDIDVSFHCSNLV